MSKAAMAKIAFGTETFKQHNYALHSQNQQHQAPSRTFPTSRSLNDMLQFSSLAGGHTHTARLLDAQLQHNPHLSLHHPFYQNHPNHHQPNASTITSAQNYFHRHINDTFSSSASNPPFVSMDRRVLDASSVAVAAAATDYFRHFGKHEKTKHHHHHHLTNALSAPTSPPSAPIIPASPPTTTTAAAAVAAAAAAASLLASTFTSPAASSCFYSTDLHAPHGVPLAAVDYMHKPMAVSSSSSPCDHHHQPNHQHYYHHHQSGQHKNSLYDLCSQSLNKIFAHTQTTSAANKRK